ncbi:DUF4105 domain-containing protein [Silvanigrella aquatica]|uniref:Uncharacterized protein n=1 Tax=Silvanigrella aquatica TaxID=1915309 RepID=A0A1L4D1E1_9BACT|nr:DUF4105 domain-containing protein [Silvanigrella aquatica]APJ04011.1 hypothetical protein AXG55_08865 [Silvanigrella aquatica]
MRVFLNLVKLVLNSKNVLVVILLLFPLSIFAQEKSSNQFDIEYFIQKSRSLELAKRSEWRKILFYQKKYFTTPRGIVDGKEFYLSNEGKFNPQAELEETIKAFFDESKADLSAQCKFPRRLKWLKYYLDENMKTLPEAHCQNLNDWLKVINPKGVVLIFSSFYMNSPSSMFGHTFLRITNSEDPLTDSGVNFAANPDTENPLLYTIKGLTGFFEGKFSLLPYSVKVQEYNNSESRDLWEYELNLTQEQTENMILSLWEVGNNRIDYFYFDENCSFILLALLDTANDKFNFSSQFWFWVNPADTVKAVYSYPGIIKNVSFRPSSANRFQYRFSLLNEMEQKLFAKIIDESLGFAALKAQTSVENAAKILDAISEYIDYKENLAGTEESKTYPLFRKQLLRARASLGVVSTPLQISPPENARPDKGVPGARLGLSLSHSKYAGTALNLEMRPVLHSLEDPSLGYSKESQIKLLSTLLRYEFPSNQLYIDKLDAVDIISIPALSPPLFPLAWNLNVAIEQDEDCSKTGYQAACQRYFAKGGTGFAIQYDNIQIFALPQIDFAYQNENAFEVSVGTFSGIALRPSNRLVIFSSQDWMNRYSVQYSKWRRHFMLETSLSILAFNNVESKIYYNYNVANSDWRVGAGIFWHFF